MATLPVIKKSFLSVNGNRMYDKYHLEACTKIELSG